MGKLRVFGVNVFLLVLSLAAFLALCLGGCYGSGSGPI
jgi:hypothetical protein